MIEHFFKIFLQFIVKGYDKQFDLKKFTAILVLIPMTIMFTETASVEGCFLIRF